MQDNEPLQRLGSICLAVDHVHYVLLKLFALSVATCPAVTSSSSLFGNEDILRIVQICICAHLDCIYDLH